jgi:hypothetical protein
MKRFHTSHAGIEDKPPPAVGSELPKKAAVLLNHIKDICRNSRDHSCFKSIKNMAADCGMAIQTAHNHKHLLYALGIIHIDKRANGKRTNPRHRITLVRAKLEPRQSTPRPPGGSVRDRDGKRMPGAKLSRVRLSALTLWKEFGEFDRLDLVSHYFKSGWQVCPAYNPIFEDGTTSCSCRDGRKCGRIGKHPKLSKSKWASCFEDKHDKLIDYFYEHPDDNVGVWLPDGLMVVDFDDLQAKEEIFGDAVPKTLTCATPRGAHFYFLAHELFRTTASRIKANVDIRAPGSWLILPPSIHKTGLKYEWDNLATPTRVPVTLVELLRNNLNQQPTEKQKARGAERKRTSSFILPEVIYHPDTKRHNPSVEDVGIGRNDHLFAYGRSLRAHGSSYTVIHAALQKANRERCFPKIDPEEMKRLINNVWNLRDEATWQPKL